MGGIGRLNGRYREVERGCMGGIERLNGRYREVEGG
jgi:hypothetical protein